MRIKFWKKKHPSTQQGHQDLMKNTWDDYAEKNAPFYIATEGKPLDNEFQWDMDAFFRQGETELVEKLGEFEIAESDAKNWSVLEIGCGIGRQTHALAARFKKVMALDISEKMLSQAKNNLARFDNIEFIHGNGVDIHQIPSSSVDIVYSFVVFQHITDARITENYFREASRVLKPGGRFLFQVRDLDVSAKSADVWSGSDFPEARIRELAPEIQFKVSKVFGQHTHYLWAELIRL
jgi:ubiquinone/menaquinone biosynthesis C-methylase UbiE